MVTMMMAVLGVALIWRYVRAVLVVRGRWVCAQISLPKHSLGSATNNYLVSQGEGLIILPRISGLALSVSVPYGTRTSVDPTVLMLTACRLARGGVLSHHKAPSPVVFVLKSRE
jgi:hypothetical protein